MMTKDKRWEPGSYETYYYISESLTVEVDLNEYKFTDKERIYCGNCFKTEAEAEAAAKKVKALLLSLHEPVTECNQLPKLTAKVFNRPDCPEWAKYAAVDSNGAGYYYSEKPFIMSDLFGWCIACSETNQSELIRGVFNNSDWQNSLIERPAKLPDWCKVGEWGFDPNRFVYFKIKQIDGMLVDVKEQGCNYVHQRQVSAFKCFKQARLRPYNAEEMRSLVGKIVTTSSGRHCTLVTACKQEYSVIEPQVMLNKWLYATDLLNGGNTIDGKPCGVFEHLENGEWVE